MLIRWLNYLFWLWNNIVSCLFNCNALRTADLNQRHHYSALHSSALQLGSHSLRPTYFLDPCSCPHCSSPLYCIPDLTHSSTLNQALSYFLQCVLAHPHTTWLLCRILPHQINKNQWNILADGSVCFPRSLFPADGQLGCVQFLNKDLHRDEKGWEGEY